MIIWYGLLVLGMLTFFAALNYALRAPSRGRIADAFEEQDQGARFAGFLEKRVHYVIATATVRSILVLLLMVIVLRLMDGASIESHNSKRFVALLISLGIVLVFAVAIASSWAKYTGEWLIVYCLPILAGLRIVLYPLICFLQFFDPVVRRLSGIPSQDEKAIEEELEQEILDAVNEMKQQGAVDEEEQAMIESVIELRETMVEHIMTPRTDMVAISHDITLEDLKNVIREKGHSRIPVYEETIDTILGVLYAKDLLTLEDEELFQVRTLMRKAQFIPETKLVKDLLHEFQEQKVHMAIVLDEYGGTAGLVTIEDILEELVGDIVDEYEQEEPVGFKRIDEQTVEVDARMRIDDLNDELDIELPEDEDYETVGGFVFSTLGKIPRVGEECSHDNIALRVIAAEPRRIKRIRMHIAPAKRNGQDA